jgi:hypothetical protein
MVDNEVNFSFSPKLEGSVFFRSTSLKLVEIGGFPSSRLLTAPPPIFLKGFCALLKMLKKVRSRSRYRFRIKEVLGNLIYAIANGLKN